MKDYKKEEYWSRVAGTYDDDHTYIVGEDIQQTIIGRLSDEGDLGEVVEFGCGSGFFSKAIAENAVHVLATDLSDEMLAMARTKLECTKNVTIEKADCENTAFTSGRFDTVVMINVIHFSENPAGCLKESYRILKSGGRLVIADYTRYGMNWFMAMRLGIRFLKKWGKPPKYGNKDLSPYELGPLVEHAGFKIEEIQLIGNKTKAIYLKGRKEKAEDKGD